MCAAVPASLVLRPSGPGEAQRRSLAGDSAERRHQARSAMRLPLLRRERAAACTREGAGHTAAAWPRRPVGAGAGGRARHADARKRPRGSAASADTSPACPYSFTISGHSVLAARCASSGAPATAAGAAAGARSGPSGYAGPCADAPPPAPGAPSASSAYTALFDRPSAGTSAPSARPACAAAPPRLEREGPARRVCTACTAQHARRPQGASC